MSKSPEDLFKRIAICEFDFLRRLITNPRNTNPYELEASTIIDHNLERHTQLVRQYYEIANRYRKKDQ